MQDALLEYSAFRRRKALSKAKSALAALGIDGWNIHEIAVLDWPEAPFFDNVLEIIQSAHVLYIMGGNCNVLMAAVRQRKQCWQLLNDLVYNEKVLLMSYSAASTAVGMSVEHSADPPPALTTLLARADDRRGLGLLPPHSFKVHYDRNMQRAVAAHVQKLRRDYQDGRPFQNPGELYILPNGSCMLFTGAETGNHRTMVFRDREAETRYHNLKRNLDWAIRHFSNSLWPELKLPEALPRNPTGVSPPPHGSCPWELYRCPRTGRCWWWHPELGTPSLDPVSASVPDECVLYRSPDSGRFWWWNPRTLIAMWWA